MKAGAGSLSDKQPLYPYLRLRCPLTLIHCNGCFVTFTSPHNGSPVPNRSTLSIVVSKLTNPRE